MNPIKISVIMGIYNCAQTLCDAIDSILNQSFSNWEFIICDDGSEDNSYEIAKSYAQRFPQKIKLISHKHNMGLNQTLNDCLELASGEFIARMDGDDISLPQRFELQLKAFEEESDLAVVSCPMIYFDQNGIWGQGSNQGQEYPRVEQLASGVIHCHAPAMIRAEVLKKVGGYSLDKKYLRVEDWNLWVKIYASGAYGKNLDIPLYMVRDDENALRRKKFSTSINEFRMSLLAISTFQLPLYYYIYSCRPILVGLLPRTVYSWLHRKRLAANKRTKLKK